MASVAVHQADISPVAGSFSDTLKKLTRNVEGGAPCPRPYHPPNPFIIPNTCPREGCGSAGAFFSCHCARTRVHPGEGWQSITRITHRNIPLNDWDNDNKHRYQLPSFSLFHIFSCCILSFLSVHTLTTLCLWSCSSPTSWSTIPSPVMTHSPFPLSYVIKMKMKMKMLPIWQEKYYLTNSLIMESMGIWEILPHNFTV